MKEYELKHLLENQQILDKNIKELINKEALIKQAPDYAEVKGHMLKAENNLRFVAENIRLKFYDWSITGCYYACYHAALALILTKGYSSKNHLATLCILIKEFYKNPLTKEDIELFSNFLDYHDVLFYVESKNKREDATYSTKILFDEKETNQLRIKAVMFVNKIGEILRK